MLQDAVTDDSLLEVDAVSLIMKVLVLAFRL